MNNSSDFIIENGVLTKYVGHDADVCVPEGVTAIGEKAFFGQTLQSLQLPDSLREIRTEAFVRSSLRRFEASSALEKIGERAFYDCEELEEITLSPAVKELDKRAFEHCTALTRADLSQTALQTLPERCFLSCSSLRELALPRSLREMGTGAFALCEELRRFVLPEKLTALAQESFSGCKALESLTPSEQLREIGHFAFKNCAALESFPLSDGTMIGQDAFFGCVKLRDVGKPRLPDEVNSCAFRGCPALADEQGFVIVSGSLFGYYGKDKKVVVPEGVTDICPDVFRENIESKGFRFYRKESAYRPEGSLESIRFPSSLRRIHRYAFRGCCELALDALPEGLEYLGEEAFAFCGRLGNLALPSSLRMGKAVFAESGLKSLRLPPEWEKLPAGLLKNCTKLKSLELPAALAEWDSDALADCDALATLCFNGENARFEAVDNVLFRRAPRELLYYPPEKKDNSYAVPEGTEIVAAQAFQVNRHLKELSIPAFVHTMGDRAFAGAEDKNRSLRWNPPKMAFTAIKAAPGAGGKRVGRQLFEFGDSNALVYPELPLSLIRERNTVYRLALGYCQKPESYREPYREAYDKYVRSHMEALRNFVMKNLHRDKALLAALDKLEAPPQLSFAEIDYKKLSAAALVDTLERAVLSGTAEDVRTVLSCGRPIELAARALGLACLYGGAEKLRVLIENQGGFRYPGELAKKYGLRHETSSNCFWADFELMSVYKGQLTVPYMLWSDLQKIHFGDTKFPEQKMLPDEKRVPAVELLLEYGLVDAQKLLYYALVWDCGAVAELLLGRGVTLSDREIELLTDASFSDILARCELQATLADYDEATGERVINRIADVLEGSGKQLVFTMKPFEDKESGFWKDRVLHAILRRTNTDSLTRRKLMVGAVSRNCVMSLTAMGELGWYKAPARREELIKLAQEKGSTEALSWLLEYKNRTADLAKEAAAEEKAAVRSLLNPLSAEELKKSWSYKKLEDGSLIITSYKGTDTEVTVPERIGKSPVSTIGAEAFSAWSYTSRVPNREVRKKITRVVLPEGIREIGRNAFWECASLEEVVLPESLTLVGSGAFRECTKLRRLNFPKALKHIGTGAFPPQSLPQTEDGFLTVNGILVRYTGEEASPTLPAGIDAIAGGAFAGHKTLREIHIPDGVRILGEGCFNGCKKLTTVTLPDTLSDIPERCFYSCESLHEIRLPDKLQTIGGQALYSCKELRKLALPEGLTAIGEKAFYQCKSLQELTLPKSLREIGKGALEEIALEKLWVLNAELDLSRAFGWFGPWGLILYAPKGSKAMQDMQKYTDHRLTFIEL
jgi:hypothetical protein